MEPSAPSGAPSSREKKYDRQLRLWGSNGQNRLEESHIALFGATATGCEILKNLILPSVGRFTIIDDKIVVESDLGVNFFLDEDSLGKSRAERAAALLGELNPDVKGDYIEDNLTHLLVSKPELFQPATSPFSHIVVVSPFSTNEILNLSPGIPTFIVHSIGFTTMLRIFAPSRCIVETHPDSLIDLRLLSPWDELSAVAAERTKNLDLPENEGGMDNHEHGHVPYVLLLLKYLEDWKASHDGRRPSSFKDKTELKDMIRNNMRTNVPGGSEENYDEAIAAVMKNVREAELSSHTRAIFEDPRCLELSTESDNFWILAHAVREFHSRADQGAGLLPLSGGIPDMKAESNVYVGLQNLYRARARRDTTLVHENVKALLTSLGRNPESIGFEEVSVFTKHSNFLRLIDYRPIAAEYTLPADDHHKKAVSNALKYGDDSPVHDYIAVRAWQEFYTNNGRHPAEEDKDFEEDLAALTGIAGGYLGALGYGAVLGDRSLGMLREVARAGGGELHVIASLAGGIVAQEIVKIITQQYVPANNTVVFDGITSRSAVFEF